MKKHIAFILSLVLCLSTLASCAPREETPPAEMSPTAEQTPQNNNESPDSEGPRLSGTVKVGVLAPITGNQAQFGTHFKTAMGMACERVNADGGINGKELVLEFVDTAGDPTQSADMCAKLAEDEEVVAILGDFASGCSLASGVIATEYEIVQFSPCSSNYAFNEISEWTFSIPGPTWEESSYSAQYVAKKYIGADTVYVFYENNDYANEGFNAFSKTAAEVGLDVVGSSTYPSGETTDFSTEISKARALNPDLVVMIDQNTTSLIVNQIRDSGWDVQLENIGLNTSTKVIEDCGDKSNGLISSACIFYDLSDKWIADWVAEYTERAGMSPVAMSAMSYDTVLILAEALRACGDSIERAAVKDNLYKTDCEFISGHIQFNEDGAISRNYNICQIEDGVWVLREGLDYADAQ